MNITALIDKVKEKLQANPQLVDKAATAVNDRTGGRFARKVTSLSQAANRWAQTPPPKQQ